MTTATDNKSCPACGADFAHIPDEMSFCHVCRFPLVLIANKYALKKELSEGGFGTVYLAHHVKLKRDAERAIKIIKPELFEAHPSMSERFDREVQTTATLSQQNEHIVRIYDDFGEQQGVGYYYVMEFLQGEPLVTLGASRQVLSDEDVFAIFFQLCKALKAAHAEGIVHRDLKPDNVFLTEREGHKHFVKLIDFGIAKPTGDDAPEKQITQGALGTPSYMAPEQCMNRGVGHRADIYAAGLLLHELLTGKSAYGFHDPFSQRYPALEVLAAHMSKEPIPLRMERPELSEGLERCLLQMLAKKPSERQDNISEVWAQLRATAPSSLELKALSGNGDEPLVQQTVAFHTPLSGVDERAKAFATPTQTDIMPTIEGAEGPKAPDASPAAPQLETPLVIPGQRKGTLWIAIVLLLVPLVGVAWFLTRSPSNKAVPTKRQVVTKRALVRKATIGSPGKRMVATKKRTVVAKRVSKRVVVPRAIVRSKVPARPRPVRRKPAKRPRRVSRGVRLCGRLKRGYRWVIGVLKAPARRGLEVSFPNCSGCRWSKVGRRHCLAVPRRRKVQLRLVLNGFQSCRHSVMPSVRTLAWRLKFRDPDALDDEEYSCSQAK